MHLLAVFCHPHRDSFTDSDAEARRAHLLRARELGRTFLATRQPASRR
jgi:hypothetical protein